LWSATTYRRPSDGRLDWRPHNHGVSGCVDSDGQYPRWLDPLAEIISRFSDAMLSIAAMPAIRNRLLQLGYETASIGADQFQRNVADELGLWAGVIGEAHKAR
jgi:hypothetical protein